MELQPKYNTPLPQREHKVITPEDIHREWEQRVHSEVEKHKTHRIKHQREHEQLHASFCALVRIHLPQLYSSMIPEHQFHHIREFKFDYCWVEHKVAVDIQGGIYERGRKSGHVSVVGMENDMEKINLAQSCGWIMLVLSPRKVRQHPRYVAQIINDSIVTQTNRRR